MPVKMQSEPNGIYRVEIQGTLQRPELERCEAALASELGRVGQVRLLFVLQDFEGWAAHSDWNDLTFYAKHGDRIERIAIVADERWRSETLMFAAAGLRKAPVEFFTQDALAEARAWLSA